MTIVHAPNDGAELGSRASTHGSRLLDVIVTPNKTEKDRFHRLRVTPEQFVNFIFNQAGNVGPKDTTTHSLRYADGRSILLGGVVCAKIRDGGRLEDEFVEQVSVLALDFDNKKSGKDHAMVEDPMTPEEIVQVLPYRGVIHSSHSHTTAHPRFRFYVVTDRDMTPEELSVVWSWAQEKARGRIDASTKNPSRMFYLPRCTQEAKDEGWPFAKRVAGPVLCVDTVLAEMKARGVTPIRTAAVSMMRRGAAPPRKKQGAHRADGAGDAKRLLDAMRDEPVTAAMLDGLELDYGAWRFWIANIVALVHHLGDGALDVARDFVHEVSAVDARPTHGYNPRSADVQFNDCVNKLDARLVDADGDEVDGAHLLFVTYEKLASHGVEHAVCEAGRATAAAPAAWVLKQVSAEEDAAVPDDAGMDPIAALRADVDVRKTLAVDAAINDDDTLRALARLERDDPIGFGRLVEALKAKAKRDTVSALVRLVKLHRKHQRAQPKVAPRGARPEIMVTDRGLDLVHRDASEALVKANTPPSVFRRGTALCRIVDDEHGCKIEDFDGKSFQLELARAAIWKEVVLRSRDGEPLREEEFFPPRDAVNAVLLRPPEDVPHLKRVVHAPFFAADGRLVAEHGYDSDTGVFLELGRCPTVKPVPHQPSPGDVVSARALLEDGLLGEFPFAHEADRAHALGLVVLPFARQMIDGLTPLHVIEAPQSNSGKSILASSAAFPALGAEPPMRAYPQREEEREKAALSMLRAARPFNIFDNARGLIQSEVLEAMLTTRVFAGRVLGATRDIVVPNEGIWVLTANNVQFEEDFARRCVRIRIDAGMEKPGAREFKKDLKDYVVGHRAALIHAALVLIQNWVALGCKPPSTRKRSSYEKWSVVIGGVLEAAGVGHFLDPVASYSTPSPAVTEAGEFVEAWALCFPRGEVTASELLNGVCLPPPETGRVMPPQHLVGVLGRVRREGYLAALGLWLSGQRDRVYGAWCIRVRLDTTAKSNRYALERVTDGTGAGA